MNTDTAVQIEIATIGYCQHLTLANSDSLPIAMVAIAWDENVRTQYVAVLQNAPLNLSKYSKIILSSLGDNLTKQVRQSIEAAGPECLMDRLHHDLRNSLHIMGIERTTQAWTESWWEKLENLLKEKLYEKVISPLEAHLNRTEDPLVRDVSYGIALRRTSGSDTGMVAG